MAYPAIRCYRLGRGTCVPEYRHYRLDGAGNINSAEWIEAADDADAVRKARELKLPVVCELWDRTRFVARIEPAKRG